MAKGRSSARESGFPKSSFAATTAATVLAELESGLGRPIRLQAESLYAIDRYDVVLV